MTAVSVDASYKECAAVEGLTGSTLRPAYDVRLMVKQVIPASLESHVIAVDADVSGTLKCKIWWDSRNLLHTNMHFIVVQV